MHLAPLYSIGQTNKKKKESTCHYLFNMVEARGLVILIYLNGDPYTLSCNSFNFVKVFTLAAVTKAWLLFLPNQRCQEFRSS